jgi:hypothetical protein
MCVLKHDEHIEYYMSGTQYVSFTLCINNVVLIFSFLTNKCTFTFVFLFN